MVAPFRQKGWLSRLAGRLLLVGFFLFPSLLSAGYSSISLMAYNVENLFDAEDDGLWQGDFTFLPRSIKRQWTENKCLSKDEFRRFLCETLDWTESKYRERLRRVADVLLSYDGRGADIIVLEEIENKRVLLDLWHQFLKEKGYRYPVHFESPSGRGIDVGIFSRYPLASPAKAHYVDLSDLDPSPTRFILEATFQLDKKHRLRIAANHWPSLAHVVDTRIRAAVIVKRIALRSKREGIPLIAMGDFNTLPSENPNPIGDFLADNNLGDQSLPMLDLQHYLGGYPNFEHSGSHFYKGGWSPLDRILVSKDCLSKQPALEVVLSSFGVHAPSYLFKTDYLTDPVTGEIKLYTFPHRYDFLTDEGYSDHLPVALKVRLR